MRGCLPGCSRASGFRLWSRSYAASALSSRSTMYSCGYTCFVARPRPSDSTTMPLLISIVTPCYNEELNVRECYERVRDTFTEKLPGYDYEHIFCDNASRDRTVEIL